VGGGTGVVGGLLQVCGVAVTGCMGWWRYTTRLEAKEGVGRREGLVIVVCGGRGVRSVGRGVCRMGGGGRDGAWRRLASVEVQLQVSVGVNRLPVDVSKRNGQKRHKATHLGITLPCSMCSCSVVVVVVVRERTAALLGLAVQVSEVVVVVVCAVESLLVTGSLVVVLVVAAREMGAEVVAASMVASVVVERASVGVNRCALLVKEMEEDEKMAHLQPSLVLPYPIRCGHAWQWEAAVRE